jgi:hypothetical protein
MLPTALNFVNNSVKNIRENKMLTKKTPLQQLELRVKRSAKHIPRGDAIYAFLQRHVADLMAAADTGDPPISVVSQKLIEEFGVDLPMPTRQFIGMSLKLIMLHCNYVAEERGVRIPHDPLFTSGSTYKKIEPEPLHPKLSLASVNEEGETLAFRLLMAAIPAMTQPEKQALLRVLQGIELKRVG